MANEPLGTGKDGQEVYLRDIWPTMQEINDLMRAAFDPETYQRLYSSFAEQNPLWNEIPSTTGNVYEWEPESTYIREPPYFDGFSSALEPLSEVHGARSARDLRRLGYDRSHQPGRCDQTFVTRRFVLAGARRRHQRLQQLRRATRQSRSDGAGHVCQRPHQEPDGAGRRRRRDDSST